MSFYLRVVPLYLRIVPLYLRVVPLYLRVVLLYLRVVLLSARLRFDRVNSSGITVCSPGKQNMAAKQTSAIHSNCNNC